MRVICVSNEEPWGDRAIPRPEVGSIYTVVETVKVQCNDSRTHLYYHLAEFGVEFLYHSKIFSTLPDVSEEELAEEEGAFLDEELEELINAL